MSLISTWRFTWIISAILLRTTPCDAQAVDSGPGGACSGAPSLTTAGILPGEYFERQAKNYVVRNDYPSALVAFKQAAYYGNKQAQYDIGAMYLKGAKKVSTDVPLGTAWLRLSALYGEQSAISALQKLEPALSSEQRVSADRQYQILMDQYGIEKTRHRVLSTFQRVKGMAAFSQWICMDGGATPTDAYVARINEQFIEYVTTMYGRVNVEPIQPLPDPVNLDSVVVVVSSTASSGVVSSEMHLFFPSAASESGRTLCWRQRIAWLAGGSMVWSDAAF
jgi:hypothetical protein